YALRRGQRDRIARQRNPDGSAYKPRKPPSKNLRGKAGGIRRKTMFAKLRTQSHLKVEATAEGLAVGFRGRSATIATAHQRGLIRTSSSGRRYVTPQRQLLGLTGAELDQLADAYLEHLSGQS